MQFYVFAHSHEEPSLALPPLETGTVPAEIFYCMNAGFHSRVTPGPNSYCGKCLSHIQSGTMVKCARKSCMNLTGGGQFPWCRTCFTYKKSQGMHKCTNKKPNCYELVSSQHRMCIDCLKQAKPHTWARVTGATVAVAPTPAPTPAVATTATEEKKTAPSTGEQDEEDADGEEGDGEGDEEDREVAAIVDQGGNEAPRDDDTVRV